MINVGTIVDPSMTPIAVPRQIVVTVGIRWDVGEMMEVMGVVGVCN